MTTISSALFSGVFFLIQNSHPDPSDDLSNALIFLGKRADPRSVTFSHYDYGIYINAISKRKNFIDINYDYAPQSNLRLYYLEKIFYSKDLTNILEIFKEFKVDYILITPEMKNGLVWNRGNEGLLYVLKNNPKYFNLIYNEKGYEIWRVI